MGLGFGMTHWRARETLVPFLVVRLAKSVTATGSSRRQSDGVSPLPEATQKALADLVKAIKRSVS